MSWWSHSTHIRCWLHPGFVKAAKLDERVGYLIVQLWNALLRRSGVTSCLFRAAWGSLVLLISERAGLLQVLTLCPAHAARQIIELVLSAFGEPSTESPQPGSDGLVAPNHLRCLRHRCRSNIPFFPVIAENATWVEVAFQKCGVRRARERTWPLSELRGFLLLPVPFPRGASSDDAAGAYRRGVLVACYRLRSSSSENCGQDSLIHSNSFLVNCSERKATITSASSP